MTRSIQTFALCAAAIALANCAGGPKDIRYRPHELRLHGTIWPPNIVAAKPISGVFAVEVDGNSAGLCCWTAPHARFSVAKRSLARELVIGVYIPDVDSFRKHPQTLTVAAPEFRLSKTFNTLSPGFHMVRIPLPKSVQTRTGPQLVALYSKYEYVPSDTRGPRYGVLLLSAYFD